MDEEKEKEQNGQEIEKLAEQRAKQRTYAVRWNLDIAIFAFAILVLVIILGFQKVGVEIVAPVAVLGLGLVWLCGWWQGKRLYRQFHDEELFMLRRELKKTETKPEETSEETTIEELVQKAMRERFK
jgi:hypothetical protein